MSKLPTPDSAARNSALIRAIELQNQGQDDAAGAAFRALLAANPNEPIALYSLAALLMKTQATDEAWTLVERGVTVAPQFAPMWFARGMVQQTRGQRDDALHSYDEALRLKPDYIEALINSGVLLREMHQHLRALERFNEALVIDPKHESALGNCGIILTEFKQSDKAIAMFECLLALNPEYPFGPGLLCYERLHACDWTDFDQLSAQIVEGIHAGKRVCKTLGLMAISGQAEDHYLAARIFAAQWFPKQPSQPLWRGER